LHNLQKFQVIESVKLKSFLKDFPDYKFLSPLLSLQLDQNICLLNIQYSLFVFSNAGYIPC